MHDTNSFNPLTGIRSFLTCFYGGVDKAYSAVFQSPHGDSFFSDTITNTDYSVPWLVNVSIPSRGFVLF